MRTACLYAFLFLGLCPAIARGDLNTQLEAHYPLDADATDASGNGHDGTIDGAVGAPNLRNLTDRALAFDGLDDDVTVPTLGNWGSELSISLWTYLNASGDGTTLLNLLFSVTSSGTLSLLVASDATNSSLTSATTVPTGRWVHLAGDWSQLRSTMRLFLDGQLVASGAIGGTPRYRTDSVGIGNFGANYTATVIPFLGELDDVRIRNHALTESPRGPGVGADANPGLLNATPSG